MGYRLPEHGGQEDLGRLTWIENRERDAAVDGLITCCDLDLCVVAAGAQAVDVHRDAGGTGTRAGGGGDAQPGLAGRCTPAGTGIAGIDGQRLAAGVVAPGGGAEAKAARRDL